MRPLAAVAFCLTACVSVGKTSVFPIEFSTMDSPKDERIFVSYKNQSSKSVCLYPTNWPNAHGEIDSGNGRIFIKIENSIYTAEDFDTGYCPGCSTKVPPDGVLTGFFKYSDFKIPRTDYDKAKVLMFSPMANYCPRQR